MEFDNPSFVESGLVNINWHTKAVWSQQREEVPVLE